MRRKKLPKLIRPALLAVCVLLVVTPSAQGAASDPLFVFTPTPSLAFLPPPSGYLEDPCGMGVDPLGNFYVSDYYHDTIDVYEANANYNPPPPAKVIGATGYLGQLGGIDSSDGPCAIAFSAGLYAYVNDYHRAVIRYELSGSHVTIVGPTPQGAHNPTGVAVDPTSGNVYVDQRTYLSVYAEDGDPVMEGPPGSEVPVHIGTGTLQDGYGIAFSQYPGTQGHLYVPDAATNTIEVYDTATPNAGPVQEIDGTETPKGEFVSLRDASIAVDRVTGEIYLVDDLQPQYTESPQAIVYVFAPDGSYEGHLKFLVTWGMPTGLAVDNSQTATQGRVYVTSGNSAFGSIYAYGPGAATTASIALPAATTSPPGGEAGPSQDEAGSGCVACEKEATAAGTSPSAMPPEQGLAPSAAPSAATTSHMAKRRPKRAHRRQRRAHRTAKVKAKAHPAHHERVERAR